MRRRTGLTEKEVSSEVKKMAERAKSMMESSEGRKAVEEIVEQGREMAHKLRASQRVDMTSSYRITL